MKKLYSFIGIWLCAFALNAQTDTYRNAINPVFQNLNKTEVAIG